MTEQQRDRSVDVLIVGSGPVGSTFARLLSEQRPEASILMVDLGPQLTARPGMNVKNIDDRAEQSRAQVQSQGPASYPYVPVVSGKADAGPMSGPGSLSTLARPGTHLVNPDAPGTPDIQMPAAAMSSNVGGMGAHWTGACPRPGSTERPPFIPADEMNAALARAEELLCVTQVAYPDSAESQAILRVLSEVFDRRLPEGRRVQPMPLACRVTDDGRRIWTGADTVLGPLADPDAPRSGRFELRSETICRRLSVEADRVTGAILEHRPSGTQQMVSAKVVIVAADTLRTPQLLWASGIRPTALGHYLNEHPLVMCGVSLNQELVPPATSDARDESHSVRLSETDPTIGVFWVPFSVPGHPFHAQIMFLDITPSPADGTTPGQRQTIVGMGWSGPKESRYEDCVGFSESDSDFFGMPKMTLHFGLSDQDREMLEGAKKEQARTADALGTYDGQRFVPLGSSLHYLGTARMGQYDDGQSVCNPYSQVWGFQNLFVGGNCTIPTALSCNPTLTSVALAVRACERVSSLLNG